MDMRNTNKLNLTEQYKQHSAETDRIVSAMLHMMPLEALALLKGVNTLPNKQTAF
jgi:hypothetical protein